MYTAVKAADGKISDNVNGTAMLGATGEGVLCTFYLLLLILLTSGNVHGTAVLGATSGSPMRLPTQPLLLPRRR